MTRAPSHAGAMHAAAMLVAGTFSTVLMKTEYGVRSVGVNPCRDPVRPGETTLRCPFDKPWFGVLQMKLAMALCLLFLYARKCCQRRRFLETPVLQLRKGGARYLSAPPLAAPQAAKQRLQRHQKASETSALLPEQPPLPGGEGAQQGRVPMRTLLAIAVPSLLDLLQTVLSNVGLLWISSSVYQMARGSVIVFSAFFSVKLMGKRLHAFHYASIAIVTLAVALVGYAGVGHQRAKPSATPSADTSGQAEGEGEGGDDADAATRTLDAALGLAFIILSQVLCALQIVVEEHMMLALNVSPMLLVGFEGLWGLAFYVLLVPVLTLSPAGSTSAFARVWHEDFYDSFVQLSNSWALVALVGAYVVAVGTLNVTGNYVTKHLSAVMRSIAETLRTLGVWTLSLFVYYVLKWQGPDSAGEPWTAFSWLELTGFVLMVYGTLAYKQLLRLPWERLYAFEKHETAHAAYRSPFMGSLHK